MNSIAEIEAYWSKTFSIDIMLGIQITYLWYNMQLLLDWMKIKYNINILGLSYDGCFL